MGGPYGSSARPQDRSDHPPKSQLCGQMDDPALQRDKICLVYIALYRQYCKVKIHIDDQTSSPPLPQFNVVNSVETTFG